MTDVYVVTKTEFGCGCGNTGDTTTVDSVWDNIEAAKKRVNEINQMYSRGYGDCYPMTVQSGNEEDD